TTFDLRNTNGVIAWSVNPNVYVAVYDPLRGQWIGNVLNTGYTTDLSIHVSTVTWSTLGGNFIQGYNPAAGVWQANSALPPAYFTASTTASNAPYSVAFVDMSIGANAWSWNFGDGLGTSTQRSPLYRYTTFGRYTATLTVGSSTTNRVVLTDLI